MSAGDKANCRSLLLFSLGKINRRKNMNVQKRIKFAAETIEEVIEAKKEMEGRENE